MTEYSVRVTRTVSCYVFVRAESPVEAVAMLETPSINEWGTAKGNVDKYQIRDIYTDEIVYETF